MKGIKGAIVLFWGFLMGSVFLLALHADFLWGKDFADASAGIASGGWARFPLAVPILTIVFFAPDILLLWVAYVLLLWKGDESYAIEQWSSLKVIAFSLYMLFLVCGGVYFAEKYMSLQFPFASMRVIASSAYSHAYAASGASPLLRNAGLAPIIPS